MAIKLENLSETRFMKKLQEFSVKLTQNTVFSTISRGMGGTMGLIMIGAVVQILVMIGAYLFNWAPDSNIYQILYMPYKLTMGLLGFFMTFSLSYSYAKKLNVPELQAGFTSLVLYILVTSPVVQATAGDVTFDALNLGNMGSGGIFVAIIVGMSSVRITKLIMDKNWVIRMPDVVPEGILNSFNSIIPTAINIIIWYGLSVAIMSVTQGQLTLASLITTVIAIPLRYMLSPVGMLVIIALNQISWFFGIHGGSVVFTAIMVPYFTAFATNSELAQAGLPLLANPVFLYTAIAMVGGTGNTLALAIMGLKSKSEQISAISKASFIPGLFNINEPVIFGFPILYNPILLIPFILVPIVSGILMYLGFIFNLLTPPSVLIMTALPVGLINYLASLDWRVFIFAALVFVLSYIIYYPFFKVYEKECIAKEAAAAKEVELVDERN